MTCFIWRCITHALLTRNEPDNVLARPAPRSRIHFDGVGRSGFDAGSMWHLGAPGVLGYEMVKLQNDLTDSLEMLMVLHKEVSRGINLVD